MMYSPNAENIFFHVMISSSTPYNKNDDMFPEDYTSIKLSNGNINTPTWKDREKFKMISSHIIALEEAKKLCERILKTENIEALWHCPCKFFSSPKSNFIYSRFIRIIFKISS